MQPQDYQNLNIADKRGDKAIAITGCDKLNFFAQTIASIAQNPESKEWPVYIFLDFPRDSYSMRLLSPPQKRTVIKDHIEIAKKTFPDPVIITRPVNFGCGCNLIDVHRQLFDNLQYDRIWFFEDDIISAPTYIGLCDRLLTWAESHYDNIGTVQASTQCWDSYAVKQKNHKDVINTYNAFYPAYTQSKKSWDLIKKDLFNYEDKFLQCCYRTKDDDGIRAMLATYRAVTHTEQDRHIPCNPDTLNRGATGQDCVMSHSLYKHGLVKLTTKVNRARYIGRHGVHMREENWIGHKFESIVLDEIDGDNEITNFNLCDDKDRPRANEK
jgi:hypothetical protein